MSFCIQQRRMARLQAVRMEAAVFANPVPIAECLEQEQEGQDLSETFQPTGKMIATHSKRVTLSKLTLEAYIEMFDLLTKGTGTVVQPNQDARKFSLCDLRQVAKINAISRIYLHSKKEAVISCQEVISTIRHSSTGLREVDDSNQNDCLEALVGMELLDPRSFATQDSVPHALSEEEMQEDLLALQWQN